MKRFILMFAAVQIMSAAAYAEEPVYVIPSGVSAGVRLYTDGLNVISTQEITGSDGKMHDPAKQSGIKKGDVIRSANGRQLYTVSDLAECIDNGNGKVTLEIARGSETLTIDAEAAEAEDHRRKLGLWVRDSTAGIGTITYFMPNNTSYAALGHGICDTDTGNILSVHSGNIQQCSLLSIEKSKKGKPGELNGTFNGTTIGDIRMNTAAGIYGSVTDTSIINGSLMEMASRAELSEGGAYIMTDAGGNGVECYSVEITHIDRDSRDTKGIVFKITDERLMSMSGGIVRGMSGAPIIRDNKLVGAVTHVFVNDPSKGYGIIGDNMKEYSLKM